MANVGVEKEYQIHQGHNISSARRWRRVTQEELSDQLGLVQSEVSTLESKRVVDKKMLQKISEVLNVSMDFLENFVAEDAMQGNYFDANFNNSLTEGSNENVYLGSGTQNNGLLLKDVKDLVDERCERERQFYEKLREKDQEIFNLKLTQAQEMIDLLKEELSRKK